MTNNDHSPVNSASAEEAGLSPTPTTGLSEEARATSGALYSGLNDPNAAALNENADAAKMRQLTGDVPGSESTQNPSGVPDTDSPEFQDGT